MGVGKFGLSKFFLIGIQRDALIDVNFLRKVIAGKEKGSTFAPANGEGETTRRREVCELFESLRPAQEGPAARGGGAG